MSNDVAICVKGLGKKYTIGGPEKKHFTIQDVIVSSMRESVNHIFQRNLNSTKNEFWAINNLSFEVHKGENIGIIGKNGAGKSTLLKILSRITAPTEGFVKINGRVGSLLEVGTGFHSELTGRENIYLSGSIIGMKRAEIDAKLDDIIKFSEIEKFLDTPVKRYSSGMYVRLAFAVAAHIDTEILIVDEVLAVGDTSFQKKCLGKMGDATNEGRTVLFVSHNMAAIKQLCSSCIYLENGQLREKGPTNTIVEKYLSTSVSSKSSSVVMKIEENKHFQLTRVRITDDQGKEISECNCDFPIIIEMTFRVKKKVPGIVGYMILYKNDGTLVLESESFDSGINGLDNLEPGIHCFKIKIPQRTLGSGMYNLYLNFSTHFSSSIDLPGIICSFLVFDATSRIGNQRNGYFSTLLNWENCT